MHRSVNCVCVFFFLLSVYWQLFLVCMHHWNRPADSLNCDFSVCCASSDRCVSPGTTSGSSWAPQHTASKRNHLIFLIIKHFFGCCFYFPTCLSHASTQLLPLPIFSLHPQPHSVLGSAGEEEEEEEEEEVRPNVRATHGALTPDAHCAERGSGAPW